MGRASSTWGATFQGLDRHSAGDPAGERLLCQDKAGQGNQAYSSLSRLMYHGPGMPTPGTVHIFEDGTHDHTFGRISGAAFEPRAKTALEKLALSASSKLRT
eukprot:11637653-Prorocentrum_lima.AAC.1